MLNGQGKYSGDKKKLTKTNKNILLVNYHCCICKFDKYINLKLKKTVYLIFDDIYNFSRIFLRGFFFVNLFFWNLFWKFFVWKIFSWVDRSYVVFFSVKFFLKFFVLHFFWRRFLFNLNRFFRILNILRKSLFVNILFEKNVSG